MIAYHSENTRFITVFEHVADPSGNSIVDAVYFEFGSGAETEVSCYNFEETFRSKKNWAEGLQISIDSEEIVRWFLDENLEELYIGNTNEKYTIPGIRE